MDNSEKVLTMPAEHSQFGQDCTEKAVNAIHSQHIVFPDVELLRQEPKTGVLPRLLPNRLRLSF